MSETCQNKLVLQPYSKSKLELEFNLREFLPVNCNVICDSVPILCDKTQT